MGGGSSTNDESLPRSNNRSNNTWEDNNNDLEDDLDEFGRPNSSSPNRRNNQQKPHELFQVIEMTKQNYHELITQLPRGFRTILLVVNQESRHQLIQLFSRVCCKYIKYISKPNWSKIAKKKL